MYSPSEPSVRENTVLLMKYLAIISSLILLLPYKTGFKSNESLPIVKGFSVDKIPPLSDV